MTDPKPLPLGQHEFEVAGLKLKKKLPPKDGKPEKAVLTLALKGPGGEQGRAEMFCDAVETAWPNVGSKETLVIAEPAHSDWLPKASRPRSGGGGFRGGRSPADTKAIQRQHSQEMALRALTLRGVTREDKPLREEIKDWTDWFEADISGGGK